MRGPIFIFFSFALTVGSIYGQYLQFADAAGRKQNFVDGVWTLHNVMYMEDQTKGAHGRGGIQMWQVNEGTVDGAIKKRGLKGLKVAAASKIGSTPPSCKGKCAGCLPCAPVEVTVPPAQHQSASYSSSFSYHLESPYYSVAWKCRCKGKDYNPWFLIKANFLRAQMEYEKVL